MAVSFIGGWKRRTRRKPPTCRKSLTNFITYITSPWSGFELTSVVIDTDYIGSCKSNYHTITATTDPRKCGSANIQNWQARGHFASKCAFLPLKLLICCTFSSSMLMLEIQLFLFFCQKCVIVWKGKWSVEQTKKAHALLLPRILLPLEVLWGCSRLKDLKCKKLNSNCWCLRTTGIDAFN